MATRRRPAAAKKNDDAVFRFSLDGENYEIDPDGVTWGETENVEEVFGLPIDAFEPGSSRNTMTMIYLAIRRKRPDFDIEELRNMPVTKIAETVSARPTETEGATAGSPS